MSTPTPVPAPAPKSGGALKIILIVLGVIALVVVLGIGVVAYGCYRLAHSIAHSENGKTTLNIPGAGTMTTGDDTTFTPDELGVDVYPGAKAEKGGSKLSMPSGTIVTALFSSSDSVAQVEAFYKDKFGSNGTDFGAGSTAVLSKKIGNNDTVLVTLTADSAEVGHKTKIVIQHTKATGK